MKSEPSNLPEDCEQTQARAEGAGVSRLGLALAFGCFLIIILLATMVGRRIRLTCWLLKFLPSIRSRKSNKIQPLKPQLKTKNP